MSGSDYAWPCSECGGRGARNIGTRGYCGAHLSALYATFDPIVWQMHGVGLQAGPLRPDWGPAFADLQCTACAATWVGVPGEGCWWCARAHQVMLEHQAHLVLRQPDVDPSDARYAPAMKAWAHRLANAVSAGVVERDVADRTWRRAVTKRAA